jgi:hypothetical protein
MGPRSRAAPAAAQAEAVGARWRSVATASPRAAATPQRSPDCARRGTSTSLRSCMAAGCATPGVVRGATGRRSSTRSTGSPGPATARSGTRGSRPAPLARVNDGGSRGKSFAPAARARSRTASAITMAGGEDEPAAGQRAVHHREGGRRAPRALDRHDPALLPRGPHPRPPDARDDRPVRFRWSEVEAAWDCRNQLTLEESAAA